MTVERARAELTDAKTRRTQVDQRVDELWHDAARRTFLARIKQPLDVETARLDTALQQLAVGLDQALAALD